MVEKKCDLEERTLKFSINVRNYVKVLPKSITNIEYAKQLVRSSSSIGANYLEANGKLSKKDFILRIKICRKEAKETVYWLSLTESDKPQEPTKSMLVDECAQFVKIFGAILEKSL